MIQIGRVPDDLDRQRKIRAEEADMTLSDSPKAELQQVAARPTLAQIAETLRSLTPVELDEPVVDVLRNARERR